MKVRIYIIGFNSQKRVDRAFDSIPDKYSRVLLDNGSKPLTAPEGVELIKTGPGMFTSAFNYALINAHRYNDVPIICNDDIVAEPGCFETLIAEIEAGAGIACPMQVDSRMPTSIIMGGTGPAFPAGIHRTGVKDRNYTEKHDYPWLPFCVVALNPALIEEIGYLDKNLKLWFSDSDYCIRARNAGYSVMYLPDAVVRHEHSAAVQAAQAKNREKMDMQFIMDRAYFERKYGGSILEEYK